MPTNAEQDELQRKCKWTWTSQNGVKGYKVVGPNGNSIFLPAAGSMDNSGLRSEVSVGFYWSSSLYTDRPSSAYGVFFYSGNVYRGSDYVRFDRFTVRPVCQ